MRSAFQIPEGGAAEALGFAKVLLYRESPFFQQYFYAIQKHVRYSEMSKELNLHAPRLISAIFSRIYWRLHRSMMLQSYDVEVILCGVWQWQRVQEDRFLVGTLKALAADGMTTLVLGHFGGQLHKNVNRLRKKRKAIHFLDPGGWLAKGAPRLALAAGRARAQLDFAKMAKILSRENLALLPAALPDMTWCATRRLEWENLAGQINFHHAIVRAHWLPLCSAVAHTAIGKRKQVSAFQQGVVGPGIDVPIIAHRFLCSGACSERVLRQLEENFARDTGREPICQEFDRVGCLGDRVVPQENNFHKRTLLVLDRSAGWVCEYLQLHDQNAALMDCLVSFCRKRLGKIVLRPHPTAEEFPVWRELKQQFPECCELSSPHKQTLREDISRASAAIGLFSGALPVAAASGIPAYFLKTENGFWTKDLDCFSHFALTPSAMTERIERLFKAEPSYLEEAMRAKKAAKNYFEKGGNFDPADALPPAFAKAAR